ncbi:serpentine type 7TM GPCR chemoreceptor srd domain-containing protein [Ditylenchus destructor]|uniref:Serpentine receptor class gamma n=1 Tax=Ditylenchus destructor TaxID=166010 RepID=A0AAD4QW19_9BILA|nr:serpentine type 7TM GPCR chemoreceptor srd domain-containing protein [Ditylenchus destructor]
MVLNILLFWLIRRYSAGELNYYRRILQLSCVVDLIASIAGFICQPYDWTVHLVAVFYSAVFSLSYTVVICCEYKMYKILRNMQNHSSTTGRAHKQMHMALIAIALSPLFSAFPMLLFLISFWMEISLGAWVPAVITIFVNGQTIFNPLITIALITPFRRAVLKPFKNKINPNSTIMGAFISQATHAPFIFSLFIGVPSLILYIFEVIILIWHRSKFRSAYFRLFIARFIPNIVNYFTSYFYFRLGRLGLFLGLFQSMPSQLLAFFFFFNYYTFHADNLSTMFILLNRLTLLIFPVGHVKDDNWTFTLYIQPREDVTILLYAASWLFRSDVNFFLSLANQHCWIHDLSTIVLPAWFLLWASSKVKECACESIKFLPCVCGKHVVTRLDVDLNTTSNQKSRKDRPDIPQ